MRNSTTDEPGNGDVDVKKETDENNKENSQKNPKMGEKSPQKQPKQQTGSSSGKGFTCEVVLLDGEHVNIELDKNAEGKELFEKLCQHLDLKEHDYFGLQYVDERLPHHLKCWLSPQKKISRQKKRGPWVFDFALKFYPPDPTQLKESLTRWLVTLQVRRDILSGKLPATFLTQAMLGSYCVQADLGDYDPNDHHGYSYIEDIPFSPNQTPELLEKIVELHKQHKGQTPDEAELHFLENAKKLSMYGVDLHAAQDVNNIDIMLGVCASGLQVYKEKLRISRFVWPKILKISYKRRHFYIKIRPSENNQMENTVSFKLGTHRLAKRLWKICVEHHAFFRLREAEQPQNSAMFPRLGSKFRYSGRTLVQARHSSQILDRPDPHFERSQPARSTVADPSNARSRSVDELANRPTHWDNAESEVRRRPSEGRDGVSSEGRDDQKVHRGQPTILSQLHLKDGMKPVENEEGAVLEPGSNRTTDGKDRRDRKPGEDDAVLNKEAGIEGTMGLSPAEMQKKAKEDEKERKKREKEEEKRRKKEEEDRKKAEKAAKKGKGKGALDPSAEDRRDLMAGGDNTEKSQGRTPSSHGDQEGGHMRFEMTAPLSTFASDDKDRDKDKNQRSPGEDGADRDRWAPGKDGTEKSEDRWRPRSGRDDEGRDLFAPGRVGDKDREHPGREGADRDRWAPGKDGTEPEEGRWRPGTGRDAEGGDRRGPGGRGDGEYSPGRDGEYKPGRDGEYKPGRDGEYRPGRDGEYSPGRDGEYRPGRDGEYSPGKVEDGRKFVPGEEDVDSERARWAAGVAPLGAGRDEKERIGSDKDDDDDKDKKGKKGLKKDKDRKGSDKDEDKDGKDKKDKKDKKKDKDADKAGKDDKEKDKKGLGLFSKFKKPKDSKSKLPDDEAGAYPGRGPGEQHRKSDKDKSKRASFIASLCPGQSPSKKEKYNSSASSDEEAADQASKTPAARVTNDKQSAGTAYPGYGPGVAPGLGIGAGDMTGVVGKESWIDNKMSFVPVDTSKRETRASLKSGRGGIDHTMPFFSPAATSTVGRPNKVPPPVPPKVNSSFGLDDSFNRSDPPTVATESVQYQPDVEEVLVPTKNVPIVKTETRTVTYEREGFPFTSAEDGVLVSASSHSTRMQTIETTTYKTEKDGIQETRVEHKVVLSYNDDDIDHDAALAEAIRSVTEFNPDMSVERIECVQQIEEVKDK